MAKDLLWELGVEEVPARFLPPVVKQLKELAEEAFAAAGLSYDELRVRLHTRNTDNEAEIERRLGNARGEIEQLGRYRYAVINDDKFPTIGAFRGRRHQGGA